MRAACRMALAALKAGLAFSNTKTALAHSISYEMTLRFGLPHGIACSFTLPMVLRARDRRRPGRDAVLARVFDDDYAMRRARSRRSSSASACHRVRRLWRDRRRFAPYGRSGDGRRARQKLHRCALTRLDRIDRITNVIDRISIWSGKTVAWLIVPMFAVLVYEVIARKFFYPTIWANDIATMCYGAHFSLPVPIRCICKSTSAPISSRRTGR